jgi:thioredoxin 1
MDRRTLLVASLACVALGGGAVPAAAGVATFDSKAFAAAQEAGEGIVVWVHAPWWPTCQKQEPIVHRLSTEPQFSKVKVFKVDFDSSQDLLRQWKVTQQSTLIAFKGRAERLRSIGQTEPGALRKVFEASR